MTNKKDAGHLMFRHTVGEDDEPLTPLERLTQVILGVVLLGLLLIAAVLSFGGYIWEWGEWDAFAKSLGGSVIASLIVYLLVSVFFEPRRNELRDKKLQKHTIHAAYAQFQRLFEASLPVEIFSSSEELKPEFSKTFAELLIPSTHYEVKGTSCRYASFRLHKLGDRPEFRDMDINLLMLDPRDKSRIRANVRVKAETAEGATPSVDDGPSSKITVEEDLIKEQIERIREEIYVTLFMLFELRRIVKTTVYLHHDLPFFRTEHFDGGVMLSYYVGQDDFHETLVFLKGTRQFTAYSKAKELTKQFAGKVVRFSDSEQDSAIRNDEAFSDLMVELECPFSTAELLAKKRARIATLEEQVSERKLMTGGVF